MKTLATPSQTENEAQFDDDAVMEESWPGQNIALAREQLAREMQQSPEDGKLSMAAGHLEMSLENFEAARDAFARAARLLQKTAAAHSSLALACLKLGRRNEAGQAALRAIALQPDDATGLKVLARIHLDAGQHEAALMACQRILRHDRRDEEARELMGEAKAQKAALAENIFANKPLL
jgi:Flp pilus assembly protein TadD